MSTSAWSFRARIIAELLPDGLAPWIPNPESVRKRARPLHRLGMSRDSACALFPERRHRRRRTFHRTRSPSPSATSPTTDCRTGSTLSAPTCCRTLSKRPIRLIISNPPYVDSHGDGGAAAGIRARAADRAGRRRRRARRGAHHRRPFGTIPESRRRAGGRGRPQSRGRGGRVSAPAVHLARNRRAPRTACSCSSATSCSPLRGRLRRRLR